MVNENEIEMLNMKGLNKTESIKTVSESIKAEAEAATQFKKKRGRSSLPKSKSLATLESNKDTGESLSEPTEVEAERLPKKRGRPFSSVKTLQSPENSSSFSSSIGSSIETNLKNDVIIYYYFKIVFFLLRFSFFLLLIYARLRSVVKRRFLIYIYKLY